MAALQYIADRIAHYAQTIPAQTRACILQSKDRVVASRHRVRMPKAPRLIKLPNRPKLRFPSMKNIMCLLATLIVLVWAGLWNIFSFSHMFSEQASQLLGPMLALSIPLTLITFLTISTPKLGGLLLLPFAMMSSVYFHDQAQRFLFAAPAIFMGAALVYSGPWVRFKPRLNPRSKKRSKIKLTPAESRAATA